MGTGVASDRWLHLCGLLKRTNQPTNKSTIRSKAAKEAEAKAAAERGLPPPEAVSKLIAQRRSIFPKDYTGAKIPKGKVC